VHTDDKGEDDDGFKSVGKGGKTMQFSSEVILKNLQAVQEARGKKVRFCSGCLCGPLIDSS
jgi:hypothetical protein